MKIGIALFFIVLSLHASSASAWFMECQKTNGSKDTKISLGFTENRFLVNLEHHWLVNGVLTGAAYSNKNQADINWPLGVYSGTSKNRGLVVSMYKQHSDNEFVAIVTDYDFSARTMEVYEVVCPLKE